MAVIVCHGSKGGIGTTFIASHVAMSLAQAGADVTLLTVAARDTAPLHFGLPPATVLPLMSGPAEDAVLANGISLRRDPRAPEDADFVPMISELGYISGGAERTLVVDVPSAFFPFARRLVPHAALHVCALDTAPDTLALLPQVLGEATPENITRTNFVLNRVDETRRLSRHAAAFIRELVGPRLLGRVRRDEAVREAIAMLQPLDRYAPTSAALHDMRAVGEAVVPFLEAPGRNWVPRTPPAAKVAV